MVAEIIWYIRIVEIATLAVAFLLVVLAYGGYKKSRSASMLSAALGFGMLGIASLVEGLLFEVAKLPFDDAHAFRSTLTALGLLILLYSIYRTR